MARPTIQTKPFVQTKPVAAALPPVTATGPIRWLRREVFSSPQQAAATVIGLYIVYLLATSLLDFAIVRAVWSGEDRTACLGRGDRIVGACWPFIGAKLGQFLYGFYPSEERWRVNLVYGVAVALLVPLLVPKAPFKLANALGFFGLLPILAYVLLYGGPVIRPWLTMISVLASLGSGFALAVHLKLLAEQTRARQVVGFAAIAAAAALGMLLAHGMQQPALVPAIDAALLLACCAAAVEASLPVRVGRRRWGLRGVAAAALAWSAAAAAGSGAFDTLTLRVVRTSEWGGLFVTLVVATTGIVASLPIGIGLALARRSSAKLLRVVATAFIEIVRGVPLITILFFATYMLPLFLEHSPDALVRVLVGVSLFAGAYMAETVRSGLQAIPAGQHEAAAALGLDYARTMGLVVMPQALRLVIPGIVNTFIGLFKDTTLVSVVAIFDLLGGMRAAFTDPEWGSPSTLYTGFAFTGIIYFLFCFLMSSYSRWVEDRLRTGHRT